MASEVRRHEVGKSCASAAALFDTFMMVDKTFVLGVDSLKLFMKNGNTSSHEEGTNLVHSMGRLQEQAAHAKLSVGARRALDQFDRLCGVGRLAEAINTSNLSAFKKLLLEEVILYST